MINKLRDLLTIGIATGLMLSSCNNEESPERFPQDLIRGERIIEVQVSTVGYNNEVDATAEKIRSLRIILLSDGYVEYNQKIDFTGGEDAPGFVYNFSKTTVPGNKRFYLLANEESVDNINIPGKSEEEALATLLDSYTNEELPASGTAGYQSGKAQELEGLLNAISFSPEYPKDGASIFLPYSSYYEGITMGADDKKVSKTMYLVPVATKLTFRFTNYRRYDLELQKLEFSSFSDKNYLMANLEDGEKDKKFNDERLYWIDWLHTVNTSSWANDWTPTVNDWIMNYKLPEGYANAAKSFIEAGQPKTLSKGGRTTVLGPYYYPETKFDNYTMSFTVKEAEEVAKVFDNNPVTSLKSLFRSTHVVINVELSQLEVMVYAEIEPWKEIDFKGYLEEDDED